MAQVYANGVFLPSNKSIFEVVTIANSSGGSLVSEGRIPVEPLGTPLVARQLIANSTSQNTPLTVTCRRISMYARNADIRYMVGSTSQTANTSSHFIATSERLDIDVPATPNIAIIRAGSTDGILEITELS